jgi:HK97 family phage major capsid protein
MQENEMIQAVKTELQPLVDKLKNYVDDKNAELKTGLENLNDRMTIGKPLARSGSWIDPIVSKAGKSVDTFKNHGKTSFDVEIKSAATAVDFGLTTTTGAGVVVADRLPGIASEPVRTPTLLETIVTGTTNSDRVTWVEKTDEAGDPAFRKEFETFPQRSWKTTMKTAYCKKLTVFSDYSREILEDVADFEQELRRDLVEKTRLALESNILNGEGGAEADQDLKGILEYAQAWGNGTFTVDAPSVYDVLSVAINQIKTEHHNPNVIMMHPSTAMQMELTKDDNGQYVTPPFVTASGTIKGLPIVTTTLLNEGEALVMDGTRARFLWRRNWTMEISDSHGDNFVEDTFTVRLTGRGALVIKDTDAKAFVHVADIDTAIVALTAAS